MYFSKKQKIWLILSFVLFTIFVGFTLMVALVDVDQVGLSHLNQFVWQKLGRNVIWEHITDWLGYLVILLVLGIVAWQIVQAFRRKNLMRIDQNLLVFDVVCAILVAFYAFFEFVVINYRPELVDGVAKASYPSSHVMLFATIIPLLIWQVWHYFKTKPWRIVLTVLMILVAVLGVIGRLLSGVHWFTDILAGLIISGCMGCLYQTFVMVNK